MKLKLRLNASEIKSLHFMLKWALTRCPVNELKQQPNDYLLMSVLFDVYQKVNAKNEHCQQFIMRSDKTVSVTITQAQALALDLVINPLEADDQTVQVGEPLVLLETGSYEWDLARRICELIYKTYYE